MTSEKKTAWTRIPVRFLDPEEDSDANRDSGDVPSESEETEYSPDDQLMTNEQNASDEEMPEDDDPGISPQLDASESEDAETLGGPALAELIATRAELKRSENEVAELKDRLARRQADFENYRKRIDKERTDTYNRSVADIAAKLLPVLDNLKRALETEASLEATESDEFRHFLSGVDLIHRQLDGVLDALGVKPVAAVGETFDPHLHEAVITEPSDEHEPDTVTQEIVRGYRLGDKLIRPALVKVAIKE